MPLHNEFARAVLAAQQPVIDESDAHILQQHRKQSKRAEPVVMAVAAMDGASVGGRRKASKRQSVRAPEPAILPGQTRSSRRRDDAVTPPDSGRSDSDASVNELDEEDYFDDHYDEEHERREAARRAKERRRQERQERARRKAHRNKKRGGGTPPRRSRHKSRRERGATSFQRPDGSSSGSDESGLRYSYGSDESDDMSVQSFSTVGSRRSTRSHRSNRSSKSTSSRSRRRKHDDWCDSQAAAPLRARQSNPMC